MKKVWLAVVSLAVLLSVRGLSGCAGSPSFSGDGIKVNLGQQEGIWVNGTGKVSAVPDLATLSLSIEAQATTVAEAQAQAKEAMDRVMKALTDGGIDKDKDIPIVFGNAEYNTECELLMAIDEIIR